MAQKRLQKLVKIAELYGATRLILFGSAMSSPETARDLDVACDGIAGWKLYEFAARAENELKISLDVVPLTPRNQFIEMIEKAGRVLI